MANVITGTAANNTWSVPRYQRTTVTYDGLDGIDTVDISTLLSYKRCTIKQNSDGSVQIDSSSQATHIILKNVERLYTNKLIDLTTYFPKIVSFSPIDSAINAPIDAPIILTFDRAITNGTGAISIHEGTATGPILEAFNAATKALLTFSNETLTITPSVKLAANTHYFVTIDAGAVKDTLGNSYIDTASYDFTTQAAGEPSAINHSPVVSSSILPLAKEGVALSYDANRLFTDSDSDTLSFTADNLPSWLTMTTNGNLTGTPSYTSADTSGDSINLIAHDGHGGNALATLTLNITNVATITGTAGADTLLAGLGADTVLGAAGKDTINGGLDNDQLTGGAGADTFVFNTPLSSTNIDTITDFVHGTDKIQLARSIMATVGGLGVLKSADFKLSTAKLDGTDRIIYNKTTGDLFYDSDGSGSMAAVKVAIIGTTKHPTLSNTDFMIV